MSAQTSTPATRGTAGAQARFRLRRPGWPGPGVIVAQLIVVALIVAAIAPGVFTSVDPLQSAPAQAFLPPSAEHWFGTDQLGRDLYSRVIWGAQQSIALGVGATAIGLVGGAVLGVIAGYSRGVVDRVLSRFLEVLLAFPDVLLALITITVLGAGQSNVIWAIGIGRIPGAARLVRAQVLQVRGSGYVQAAVVLGQHPVRLVAKHVLPNAVGSLIVSSIIGIGTSIIFGAALSFLGLGAQPPTPEWGLMLSEARQYLSIAPWTGIWPGAFITLTVVSVTVTGRWLQQRFVSKRSSL
ncbi:MAG: ABC transporter permease [Mycetocola sp.]